RRPRDARAFKHALLPKDKSNTGSRSIPTWVKVALMLVGSICAAALRPYIDRLLDPLASATTHTVSPARPTAPSRPDTSGSLGLDWRAAPAETEPTTEKSTTDSVDTVAAASP